MSAAAPIAATAADVTAPPSSPLPNVPGLRGRARTTYVAESGACLATSSTVSGR